MMTNNIHKINLTWASIEMDPGVYTETNIPHSQHHYVEDDVHVSIHVLINDQVPYDLEGLSPEHPEFIRRFNDMMDYTLAVIEDEMVVDDIHIDGGITQRDQYGEKVLNLFADGVKEHMEEVDPSVIVNMSLALDSTEVSMPVSSVA